MSQNDQHGGTSAESSPLADGKQNRRSRFELPQYLRPFLPYVA